MNQTAHMSNIYYLCPDTTAASAGIRRLYRHVNLLCRSGFNAHIMHMQHGFQCPDMPGVPVCCLDRHTFSEDMVLVIPEGMPTVMNALKNLPVRRFAIALNWDYVFKHMPQGVNWCSFNIERVMVISPSIGRMIAWSMGLPTHRLESSINHQIYYPDAADKRLQLVYIKRKAAHIEVLKRLLCARNPDYTQQIEWIGLNGLSEEDYAAQIRKSAIFLNLSEAEGYPTSCLEAMAAGTIVAGYDSLGGRDLLLAEGKDQNCYLAPNGNYISLAYLLDPVLKALLQGDVSSQSTVIANALNTVADINLEKEHQSLINFWESVC